MTMTNIFNYVQYNEYIATSGQPEPKEFRLISNSGARAVVNLAMPDSDGAIADEGHIVTSLGMSYFHIPVPFDAPRIEQVILFIKIMESLKNDKVWVHCIANYRVSAFMTLYQRKVYGASDEQAKSSIFEFWKPDEKWQKIINISHDKIIL